MMMSVAALFDKPWLIITGRNKTSFNLTQLVTAVCMFNKYLRDQIVIYNTRSFVLRETTDQLISHCLGR